ncbi:MAG: hypothetical protein KF775_01730 [Cyclobacteriaceae bacterium]|nr:hypothetical protein [Cyclobacteriaceae bacterium]
MIFVNIRLALCLAFVLILNTAYSQFYHGFEFGKITYDELTMRTYALDTAAEAVVLDEFGEAYFDNDGENNLLLEYHVKIKILKTGGLQRANFRVLLRKNGTSKEFLRNVSGITFNFQNGTIKEAALSPRDIRTTALNQARDETNFALPEVRVGSVIEVRYTLESPFIFNFYPWKFQSDIPKVRSEFWARIPANYNYNISLRGFLQLSKNETTLVKDCFTPGANRADCSLSKYVINNIPALVDEDFMLARSNFLAGIDYELSEIKRFTGVTTKFTKTWKDVVRELNTDEEFGAQIRKARNLWQKQVEKEVLGKSTPREKAQAIYELIKGWYLWNEYYGIVSREGVKKAYDERKGSIASINLSLVAALQQAGLQAEPVILATREAGLPNQLYPIISDFDYVVASVVLDDEYYLLDASDPLLPFGLLPRKCLNGTGRLIPRKDEDSKWIDLKPREKDKTQISLNLKLNGKEFTGEMVITAFGYDALDKRREIAKAGSEEKYREALQKKSSEFEILEFTLENPADLSKPVLEKYKVKLSLDEPHAGTLYINPFLVERWTVNPFKSNERNYPVDFGAPLESTFMFSLEFPANYVVDEIPASTALALPQNGGRFLCNATHAAGKITVTSIINLTRSVYSSTEYHTLKELFSRIVSMHQSHIVLKHK